MVDICVTNGNKNAHKFTTMAQTTTKPFSLVIVNCELKSTCISTQQWWSWRVWWTLVPRWQCLRHFFRENLSRAAPHRACAPARVDDCLRHIVDVNGCRTALPGTIMRQSPIRHAYGARRLAAKPDDVTLTSLRAGARRRGLPAASSFPETISPNIIYSVQNRSVDIEDNQDLSWVWDSFVTTGSQRTIHTMQFYGERKKWNYLPSKNQEAKLEKKCAVLSSCRPTPLNLNSSPSSDLFRVDACLPPAMD